MPVLQTKNTKLVFDPALPLLGLLPKIAKIKAETLTNSSVLYIVHSIVRNHLKVETAQIDQLPGREKCLNTEESFVTMRILITEA